jgi:hypothetical protein
LGDRDWARRRLRLTLPNVDPARLALSGYLALRGASGEPHLAACIADPGLRAVMTRERLGRLGLGAIDAATPGSLAEKAIEMRLRANPRMRWAPTAPIGLDAPGRRRYQAASRFRARALRPRPPM